MRGTNRRLGLRRPAPSPPSRDPVARRREWGRLPALVDSANTDRHSRPPLSSGSTNARQPPAFAGLAAGKGNWRDNDRRDNVGHISGGRTSRLANRPRRRSTQAPSPQPRIVSRSSRFAPQNKEKLLRKPQRMKCTRQRHSGQGVFFWTSRATGAPADSSSGSTLVSFVPPWNWTCNWFFPYKRSTSGRRPA